MISTKCDKCKNKALCWSCNECQSKPFQCFVCNETITYRERLDHLQTHLNNPTQYLVCRMCKVNKHISQYNTLSLFISCSFCKSLYPQGGGICGSFISLIFSGLL